MSTATPGFDPGRVGALLYSGYAAPELTALARRIESLGFGTIWYADERLYRDSYAGLALCAAATSRIRLGPAVSDPYSRHPASTAASIATVDEIAGGRAVLGFGAGGAGFEYLGLGRPRPVRAVSAALRIIRGLLRGETVTDSSSDARVVGCRLEFPVRPVDIYLAAEGPRMLELAGSVADGVVIAHAPTADAFGRAVATAMVGCEAAGRATPPKMVSRLDVGIADDDASGRDALRPRVARYLWARYPHLEHLERDVPLGAALHASLQEAGPYRWTHDPQAFSAIARHVTDEVVDRIAVCGTARRVRQRLADCLAAGADELMLNVISGSAVELADALERLAGRSAVGAAMATGRTQPP